MALRIDCVGIAKNQENQTHVVIPYIVQTTGLREMRVLCEDVDDIVKSFNCTIYPRERMGRRTSQYCLLVSMVS